MSDQEHHVTRRGLLATAGSLAAAISIIASAEAQTSGAGRKKTMDIIKKGSQPSQRGPAEYFTGTVNVDSRFQRATPARAGGGIVTFEPGARTAWHTHPLGQTVIVTAGRGWAQLEGGAKEEIEIGDVVWFPPGVRHWHGATDKTGMTHIAISESLDGKSVEWMEKVTDAQYAE